MLPIGDDNSQRRLTPYVTWLLILLNVAAFMVELSVGALSLSSGFLGTWAAQANEIRRGEALYTLVTSMFLHGGWLHLLSNMLYLWIFGDNVEDALGHLRYLVFYLAGGVVAALANVYMSGISNVPSLGASGAIAAVLGAYLVMFPGQRIRVVFFFGLIFFGYVSAVVMIAFWALLQFVGGLGVIGSVTGGVAYWAHIGGFVFGVLVGLLARGLGAGRRARPVYE